MRKKGKRETKAELPELCVAVKKVREAYGDSQQGFAQRVGLSLMSISRFELGRVPRDPEVLWKLTVAAREAGLIAEWKAFGNEANRARGSKGVIVSGYLGGGILPSGLSANPPRLWRLMIAVRLAALFYPENVSTLEKAVEQAAGPALALVDAVLQDPQNHALEYTELEHKINQLAEQQALSKLQQPKKNSAES